MLVYKYRLYPNKTQEKLLAATLRSCKDLYNKCLEEKIALYRSESKSISAYDQIAKSKTYGVLGLDSIHSQVIQQVILRLDNSFKQFFCRVKRGDKPGFPRFKNVERFSSFCYPQSGFKLKGETLIDLSKIGSVKIKTHRPLLGTVKRLIIKRDNCNKWFACFVVSTENTISEVKSKKPAVGLDLGCQSFVTLSTGVQVKHPHYYRQAEAQLAQAQSKYSKLKQQALASSQKLKAKSRLNKLSTKVQNQRIDFTHKLSRALVDEYAIICVEDLDIKGLTDNNFRRLNKSIMDSGWSQFTQQLVYKAENAGSQVIKVNPAYTSQICSNCGVLVKKPLTERIHKCACGLKLDRDINAALNILSFGMKLSSSKELVDVTGFGQ